MKLKNFKIYLKAIEKQAKLFGVKIKIVPDGSGNGYFDPNRRLIMVDASLPESLIISTLLHELGHFQDAQKRPKVWESAHHYYGYDRLHREFNKLAENQKKIVWDCELEAWRQARGIARGLKIPLGKWFINDEKKSLNSYRGIKVG